MIISDTKKDPSGTSAPSLDRPSTSTISPPSFEESTGIHAPSYSSQFGSSDLFIPQGGEEPPPEFTPYEAEFFVSGDSGDIVSHDRHLNQDDEQEFEPFVGEHAGEAIIGTNADLGVRGAEVDGEASGVVSRLYCGADGRF